MSNANTVFLRSFSLFHVIGFHLRNVYNFFGELPEPIKWPIRWIQARHFSNQTLSHTPLLTDPRWRSRGSDGWFRAGTWDAIKRGPPPGFERERPHPATLKASSLGATKAKAQCLAPSSANCSLVYKDLQVNHISIVFRCLYLLDRTCKHASYCKLCGLHVFYACLIRRYRKSTRTHIWVGEPNSIIAQVLDWGFGRQDFGRVRGES